MLHVRDRPRQRFGVTPKGLRRGHRFVRTLRGGASSENHLARKGGCPFSPDGSVMAFAVSLKKQAKTGSRYGHQLHKKR